MPDFPPMLRRTAFLLILGCTAHAASAQDELLLDVDPLIVNVDGRTTTSLDGRWRAIVDPFQTGYYSYRMVPNEWGFFRDQQRESPSQLIEYDFDKADLLHVPGDWNSQREDLTLYEGTIWYRQTFAYDLEQGRRLFVHFGGANYETRAWLNGEPLGEHEGGFTPFNFEATDLLRPEGNSLVVMVDNKRRADAVPTNNSDWWNYGGLTRSVNLVETPATFVRDYFLQLDPEAPDFVAGWVQVDGPTLRQDVRIAISEIGAQTDVTTNDDGYAEVRFPVDIERWTPENPRRYTVTVSAGGEDVSDRIGFRTIETRGSEILLNGEPLFLRGISMHEEAPYEPRRASSEGDAQTLLGWAQDLGANFVRLAHYPHNETMVQMADSMGLLVWGEIPVYWTIDWTNPATLANARNQLSEMITRDKNRAAVVFWSVANETPLSEPRLDFLTTLVSDARAMDPTRLITAALEHHYVDDNTLMIDDPLGAYLDVLGNNEYIGWYDGPPEKASRISWRTTYDKPVVMSEFGGGAVYGRRGSNDEIFTEDYLASIYRHQIEMLREIPFLAGTSPWILKDFRSPRRPLADTQDFWNRKGLISDRGHRKMAFYILQGWYREIERSASGN